MGRWQFHYRIADYAIALHGTDAELAALADSLYEGAHSGPVGVHARFDLVRRSNRLALEQEGRELIAAEAPDDFFQQVEWELTAAFMRGLGAFYQLHAAVAVDRGRAFVLCGAPEAGKTSLVAGLALAGANFYSDEIALIAPKKLSVYPFPRDLIVHRGTQKLFPQIQKAQFELPGWKVRPEYCYLPPRAVGRGGADGGATCGELIFPVRQAGAAVRYRALGAAEAAGRLLEQSFNLWDWGAEAMEIVGRLVEGCPARELVFDDAREAAALLLASEV